MIENKTMRPQHRPETSLPPRMDIAGQATVVYERAHIPDGVRFARTSIPPLHSGLVHAITARYEQRIERRRKPKRAEYENATRVTREQETAIHTLRIRLKRGEISDQDYQRERNTILKKT